MRQKTMLTKEDKRRLLIMFEARVANVHIAMRMRLKIDMVRRYHDRWLSGDLEAVTQNHIRDFANDHYAAQLCLVDGCIDPAEHGKFCKFHAPKPPICRIPMSRLMAGR